MSNRRSSIQEKLAISKLLELHFNPNASTYRGGWTDAKIAHAIAPDLSVHSVANVRKAMGFNLRHAHNPSGANGPSNNQLRTINEKLDNLTVLLTNVLEGMRKPTYRGRRASRP